MHVDVLDNKTLNQAAYFKKKDKRHKLFKINITILTMVTKMSHLFSDALKWVKCDLIC